MNSILSLLYFHDTNVVSFHKFLHKIIKENIRCKLIDFYLQMEFLIYFWSVRYKVIQCALSLLLSFSSHTIQYSECIIQYAVYMILVLCWCKTNKIPSHFTSKYERLAWYWKYRVMPKIDSLNASWISHVFALVVFTFARIWKHICGKRRYTNSRVYVPLNINTEILFYQRLIKKNLK